MSSVHVVELARDPGGMARFAAVAERAREADPVLGAGPPDDDATALARDLDDGRRLAAALFVGVDRGVDVARCAAMIPDTVPGAGSGRPAGAIGFWSSVPGHTPAAEAALAAARDWLFARGLDAVGPLDLSTWHRYRFVVDGFENGRFLLEPWNRPDEVALWERSGFLRTPGYASLSVPLRPYPVLAAAHADARARGVTLVDLAGLDPQDALASLHAVVAASFPGKAGFAGVTRERFFSLYEGMGMLLTPGLSFLALDERGAPLGFSFAYPDWLEPARAGVERPTTTVLKTLARTPDAPPWLGYALCHAHVMAARDLGYTTAIFALMERWAALVRIGRAQGAGIRVHKRYCLFRCARPSS